MRLPGEVEGRGVINTEKQPVRFSELTRENPFTALPGQPPAERSWAASGVALTSPARRRLNMQSYMGGDRTEVMSIRLPVDVVECLWKRQKQTEAWKRKRFICSDTQSCQADDLRVVSCDTSARGLF